jgi:hypothetical protein
LQLVAEDVGGGEWYCVIAGKRFIVEVGRPVLNGGERLPAAMQST